MQKSESGTEITALKGKATQTNLHMGFNLNTPPKMHTKLFIFFIYQHGSVRDQM